MFSALRENSLFYILKKAEGPKLEVGQVESVSLPMPVYGAAVAGQYGVNTTVDVNVRVEDQSLCFKQLPSTLSIANFGGDGVVVSESRELIDDELEAMIRSSRKIVESHDYHLSVIEHCEAIRRELNPSLAQEKAKEDKINVLEGRMATIESSIIDIKELLLKGVPGKTSKNT